MAAQVTQLPVDEKAKEKVNQAHAGLEFMQWVGGIVATVFFPGVVMLASALAAPALGVKSFGGLISLAAIGQDPWVFAAIIACAIPMGGWYVYNLHMAANMKTNVDQLKSQAGVSILMAGIVAVAAGMQIGAYGSIYWWFLVPALFQLLDGRTVPIVCINNAGQKPLIQGT